MTDKEQIIIDGVDVSGCNHYIERFYSNCNETNVYATCRNNSNCYFKQLARKTQECEELKKDLDRSNNNFLREELKNTELTIENYRIDQANMRQKNTANLLGKQMLIYKQALEEIEREVIPLANKNLIENCWSLLDTCKKCKSKKECGNQSPYTRAKQILDIINKADCRQSAESFCEAKHSDTFNADNQAVKGGK